MAASPTPNTTRSSQRSMMMNQGNNNRNEIEAAIAKAVELRAIHSALMQGTSPSHLSLFTSSPSHLPRLHPHDYPVFTPSYEEETLPGYRHLHEEGDEMQPEEWGDHHYGLVQQNGTSIIQSEYQTETALSTIAKNCLNDYGDENEESRSVISSSISRRRRRNSLGDFKSVSSKLGLSDADSIANHSTNLTNTNIVAPLTDSHPQRKPKKAMIFSRIFSRLKKRDAAVVEAPVDALRKELVELSRERDAAIVEVKELRLSFGELRKKLDNLEGYCEELKRALQQQQKSLTKSGKLGDGNVGDIGVMPVSKEVMTEGFVQVVSEARLSVKHFCKALVAQIDDMDDQLIDNIDALLQPYKVSLIASKNSKSVLYHLEAIANEALYQDFENCVFKRNGAPKVLDPQQDRQAKFASFVALRNLSWNEVVRKGTKYYSEDFSKFCDQKMSSIISSLSWTRPWPEELLESFFVAAKCVWLLHLLSISCYPPLTILRVEEGRQFDGHYMTDIVMDRQRAQQGSSRVKVMVMPGFYVQDKVLRCKVLCRYKSFK